ncbi:hypothetical protein [Rhizohabitans arisaemae]|uniref:hypothetical protein n=1 Tax=Rhizohabitans arisaemae TaxID=2720610 RepID=UPI0024B0CDE8|nr:hypothetical protein [Rhizohabitans arisaemae]
MAAASMIGATLAAPAVAAETAAPVKKKELATAGEATKIAGTWTASKLASAKQYTGFEGTKSSGAAKVAADGKPGTIPPIGQEKKSPVTYKNVNVPKSVGRVFFTVGDQAYYCSGASIQSKYRNLVATAGHCVYDTDANQLVENWVFIPAYYQGKTRGGAGEGLDSLYGPFGIYVGKSVAVHSDFDVFEDYDRDYAFVTVFNGLGQHKPVEVSPADAKKYDEQGYDVTAVDRQITKAEYEKCIREGGPCSVDAKNDAVEVGPTHPDAKVTKKEVTKEVYTLAKGDGTTEGALNRGNGYKLGSPEVKHVTQAEFDAYTGPGYKEKHANGDYTITHYYVQSWVKESDASKYYRTHYFIHPISDVGALGKNVGGHGFTWNQPIGTTYMAWGYPGGSHPDGNTPFTGNTPKWCYGKAAKAPVSAKYKAEEQIAIKCTMTAGASGGPWLAKYSNGSRLGLLNGVFSLAYDADGNKRYDTTTSPYFDSETYDVYKAAANLWSGSQIAPKVPGSNYDGAGRL